MKIGMDQIVAWIISIIVSVSIFSVLYFITKYSHKKALLAKHHVVENIKTHQKREIKMPSNKPYVKLADVSHHPTEEINKKEHSHQNAHWGYHGPIGPRFWGELDDSYVSCSMGKNQSPIDIVNVRRTRELNPIKFYYQREDSDVINNGHSIQVNRSGDEYVLINEKRYKLLQFHFHSPSEHKVDGLPFDMEIHFVHKSDDGEFAVIGVLVEEGSWANKYLAKIWKDLPQVNDYPRHLKHFNPISLLPKNKKYYYYKGSFTTPPCSEEVKWFIMVNPIKFSSKQIDTFIHLIKFNARPVNPINDREVLKSW